MRRNWKGTHAPLQEMETIVASSAAVWKQARWGEMRVGYETYLTDFDDAELLRGLPDDRCQCPHWGYLISGRMTVRYADHEEVVEAGEAYYMAPGHTIFVEADTVLVEFSPWEQFQQLTAIAEKNLGRVAEQSSGES
jgi:hypothetical protein